MVPAMPTCSISHCKDLVKNLLQTKEASRIVAFFSSGHKFHIPIYSCVCFKHWSKTYNTVQQTHTQSGKCTGVSPRAFLKSWECYVFDLKYSIIVVKRVKEIELGIFKNTSFVCEHGKDHLLFYIFIHLCSLVYVSSLQWHFSVPLSDNKSHSWQCFGTDAAAQSCWKVKCQSPSGATCHSELQFV